MKNLYLLEKIDEKNLEKIDYNNSIIIACDYSVHNSLKKLKKEHEIIDTFISEEDREKFFYDCIKIIDKFDKLSINEFSFKNINMLNKIDRNEILEFLMEIIPKINAINNILNLDKFYKVFATHEMYNILKIFNIKNLQLIYTKNIETEVSFDKIEMPINFFNKKIFFKITRKKYHKIKYFIEKIIIKYYKLNIENKTKEKVILLEFNPDLYTELFNELNKNNIQPVLLNFRTPIIRSKKSLNTLSQSNSYVCNSYEFLDQNNIREINEYKKNINQLKILFENSQFSNICEYQEKNFSQFFYEKIIKTFEKRFYEYMILILSGEKILQKINPKHILCLNLSGESEKIFSEISKKIPMTLLQHGFCNYTEELSKYDILDDFDLSRNSIIVWGESLKKYLLEIKKFNPQKIIVGGSPRHDLFLKNNFQNDKKIILVTPRPIINHMEGVRISLFDKYNHVLEEILKFSENEKNFKIIFKLHPQQIPHNEIIKNKIIKHGGIISNESIQNNLSNSILHINIAPDNFDASTVILESMIMEVPSLNIQLQSKNFQFDFIKFGTIKNIMYNDSMIIHIKSLIYDQEERKKLLNNSKKFIKYYLHDLGYASKNIALWLSK